MKKLILSAIFVCATFVGAQAQEKLKEKMTIVQDPAKKKPIDTRKIENVGGNVIIPGVVVPVKPTTEVASASVKGAFEMLASPNGQYRFWFPTDAEYDSKVGVLQVKQESGGNVTFKEVWRTPTKIPVPVGNAKIRIDETITLETKNSVTYTLIPDFAGKEVNSSLELTNDGELQIRIPNGKVVWKANYKK